MVGERICKEKAKKNQFGHISPKIQTKVGFRRRKRALLLNLCSVRLNLLQKELVCNYEKKRESLAKQASTTTLSLISFGTPNLVKSQIFEY